MKTPQLDNPKALKLRLSHARKWIGKEYRRDILSELPHLETETKRIYNVFRYVSSDPEITEAAERIAISRGMPVPEGETRAHENHASVNPPTAA